MRSGGRQRSVFWHYLLFLLTGGLFGLLWVYLMNRDIQAVEPAHLRSLRWLAPTSLVALVLYLCFLLYFTEQFFAAREQIQSGQFHGDLGSPTAFAMAMAIALFLVVSWVYGLFSAAAFVRSEHVGLPGNFVLSLLLLVYGISLPLVQSRLNRVFAAHA
jgi:hypothetical protein